MTSREPFRSNAEAANRILEIEVFSESMSLADLRFEYCGGALPLDHWAYEAMQSACCHHYEDTTVEVSLQTLGLLARCAHLYVEENRYLEAETKEAIAEAARVIDRAMNAAPKAVQS